MVLGQLPQAKWFPICATTILWEDLRFLSLR